MGDLIVQLNGKSETLFGNQDRLQTDCRPPGLVGKGASWKGLTVLLTCNYIMPINNHSIICE